jgi:ethanolamine utilization protein EutA (predicted chaperonin)
MKFSATEHLKAAVGLKADDHQATGPTNGTGVDCVGFDECLVIVNCGTVATGGTLDIHIEDSADNSTFADISGAVFTQLVPANDLNIYVGRLNLRGTKRYIRAVAVGDGSHAAEASVSFVLAVPKRHPVTQVNTAAFSV